MEVIKMRKRLLFPILMTIILFTTSILISGCNINNSVNDNEATTELEAVPESEIEYVYSNPEKYEGRKVTLKGQVSDSVEKTENGISFTIYANPSSIKNSAKIYTDNSELNIKDDDYVIVEGIVVESSYGEGFNMDDVVIKADKVTKSNYIDVVEPTQVKYKIKKTINQNGYKVTLSKVELAKNETRVYLKVKNNGRAKFALHTFNAKIIQGHKQYDQKLNYSANYKELPGDIEKGITAKGIITFPRIKEKKNFKLKIEPYSHDWNEKLTDYVFNVHIK